MAGNSLALTWDLIARDNASPAFTRVSAAADKAAASTESAAASTEAAGSRINKVAKTLAVGAVVGVAAVGVEALKMAANFQTSTTRLVTSANESQRNLKMVQQGILALSGQVGDSAEELSAAMYKVESGGQHGAAGLEVLKAAAQGAKAENADLTTVADALTSVLQDYHLKASASADVTSKLVAATASGKMTFEELAGSLSAILPLASANHVALNDILGDLASMTIHGMSAEQASQNLADTLRHLAAPTQQQTKELAALGLSATDLSASLGSRGVSGSVEMVANAIQKRLGSGSTQILLDLNTALGKLPKTVQDFAKGMLAGTNTVGDYRKEIKALPADQAAALQGFYNLITSTHQVGSETKSAAQVYQSYSGALRLALGDATSMNTALMLTGENSKTTATAIGNVSKATADAKGNVKGWAEIQSTFNVQMQEFGQTIEADVTSLGMRLLPAATNVAGVLNRDVMPAVQHVGSGISTLAQGFSQLPGPIKGTAIAFGALALANKIGLFTALNTATAGVGRAFATASGSVGRFGDQMAVQARLAQMEATSISEVDAALGGLSATAGAAGANLTRVQMMMMGWDTALAGAVIEEDAATVSTGRLAAAMGVLSTRAQAGIGAISKGLGSAVSMIGGPWGAAMLTATAAYMSFSAVEQKSTDQTNKWVDALKKGGVAATQASNQIQQALQGVDTSNFGYKFLTTSNGIVGSLQQLVPGVNMASTAMREHAKAAQNANQTYKQWYNSLGLVDQKQQDLSTATANLSDVLKHHAANSMAVREAENKVQIATQDLKVAQDELGNATQTTTQKIQNQATAILALTDSGLASKQAYDEFSAALVQYRDDVKSGTVSTSQLTVEQDALMSQANSTRDAAGQAGAAWAKSAGIQDTASASAYGQLVALERVAQSMGKDTPAAVRTQITALQQSAAQGHLTQKQMDAITQSVDGIPTDTNIKVTADTASAQNKIDGLLKSYQNVQYTGSAIIVNGRVMAKADGGAIIGPGTGTSDSIPARLSNGEHVWTAKEVQSAGGHSAVAAMRKAVMGQARAFAAGGPVSWNIGERFPTQPSAGMLESAKALAQTFAPAVSGNTSIPGGRAAVAAIVQALASQYGWGSGAEWASLVSVINRESGWNPNAANPTSSARGLFQKMTSINGPVESTVQGQTNWGLNYIRGRYGDPINAWRHEMSAGWYDSGGWLPPGASLALNGTGKPERIRTAEQESALQQKLSAGQPAVFHLYDSSGALLGSMRGIAQQEADSAMGSLHDKIHYG